MRPMSRNLKAIQSTKPANKNRSVAEDTLLIIKEKSYTNLLGQIVDLTDHIDRMMAGTKLYDEAIPAKEFVAIIPHIEVTLETTANAAVRLLSEGKKDLVALNFASATTPGGGWLHGAIAQEEDLARCSALYTSLRQESKYYDQNILCENRYYTDCMIYSPSVPFFRDEHLLVLDEPFLLSIISAPAPNISGMQDLNEDKLYEIIKRRAVKVLQVAAEHGHKNILLGAWGCGAFGNSPEMVARIFWEALDILSVFEHVCFPVYDTRPGTPVFNVFNEVLG